MVKLLKDLIVQLVQVVESAAILEMILAITDGETWRGMVSKACGLKFFDITLVQSLFVFYIVHQTHQDTFTKISKRNLMR